MNISTYKDLIVHLPVREQCFTTKRTTWQWVNEGKNKEEKQKINLEEKFSWLKKYNETWFTKNNALSTKKAEVQTFTISRQDIFNCNNSTCLKEFILKTIYWGYSSGTRGYHFIDILSEIDKIESILNKLKNKNNLKENNLNKDDFEDAAKEFKAIKGLGLSTYSKLLYFLDIKFNNCPCLILDQRIIDVFNNNVFKELKLKDYKSNTIDKITEHNKVSLYLNYLKLMKELSKQLELEDKKEEKIEQFLFMFGNDLQPKLENNNGI